MRSAAEKSAAGRPAGGGGEDLLPDPPPPPPPPRPSAHSPHLPRCAPQVGSRFILLYLSFYWRAIVVRRCLNAIVDATRPRLDRNGTAAPGGGPPRGIFCGFARRLSSAAVTPSLWPPGRVRLAAGHLSGARGSPSCAPLRMVTGGAAAGPTEVALSIAVRHLALHIDTWYLEQSVTGSRGVFTT